MDAGRRGATSVAAAWLALGVGTVGVVFYLATFALGTNLTVVAQSLPGEWWRVPVLVLAAAQNAVLEELVVLGFVQVRLRQLGLGDSAAIGLAALLRGSYHLYQGLGGFVGNLAMGLLFGWLFRRWGRVAPFVVAHTLLDVGAFVGYAVLAGRVDWLPTLSAHSPTSTSSVASSSACRFSARRPSSPPAHSAQRTRRAGRTAGRAGRGRCRGRTRRCPRRTARCCRGRSRRRRPPAARRSCGGARQRDERPAQRDLDDAGAEDREVLVEREPVGHLRLELRALRGQVQHPRAHHSRAEQDASEGLGLHVLTLGRWQQHARVHQPAGSSARLTARIRSTSTGRTCTTPPRRALRPPRPCSALMLPSRRRPRRRSSVARSARRGAGSRRRAAPTGALRL